MTNPGTQSSTSGTAVSLQIAATDSQSGATLTFSATGLPAGLSISSSGKITGTPTTACACSVTVTATDGSSYHGSTSFTWNVTNTVTVANPGTQSSVTNTAISTLNNSASDSSSTATISSWSATGLPAGLTINGTSGAITGTPTTPGSNSVTIKATDSAGYSGTASFTWTINNTVAVTNPGTQSSASGTAISPLQIAATDSQSGATLTFSATGLPAGSVHLLQRQDHRHPDHGLRLLGDGHRHRRIRLPRLDKLHLERDQHHQRDQPGQPDQPVGHGHQPADRLGQ